MIRIENLCHRYEDSEGGTFVYNDFNIVIEDGDFIALTGKSGSGKTTLLKLLIKETEPISGTITVDGKDISKIKKKDVPYYRRNIGVLFQDFKLIPDIDVYDNLHAAILATGGSGKEADNKITHVLSMLGIDHLYKRYPKEMSGGEQQKVCLARAVINHPKYLLVDEPTGNLDPASSAEIVRLLDIIHRQGITIIMATHDLSIADSGDRRRVDLDSINSSLPIEEMETPSDDG